ncbi:hypothetical protein A5777_09515 [Gordonia sp. 852002-10350_SCH5691597]|nr:hypothetical protein A5777_09515 [Gordonia sp. 852002-10350_SCH5691597]
MADGQPDMSTAIQWLKKIQDLHSPLVPPEGMALMGSKPGDEYCDGCEWNDPYEAVSWPCDTRKLTDQALAELQGSSVSP